MTIARSLVVDAIILVDMQVGLVSGAPKLAKADVGQLPRFRQGLPSAECYTFLT